MKPNITKEQKLSMYYGALEYIEKHMYTTCGLCHLLHIVCEEQNIDIDMYDHLNMDVQNNIFIRAELEGFEEITDQVIGMKPYNDMIWFPYRDWESRKQILLNAIKTLENEHTV